MRYVVGFMFDESYNDVLMIRKTKPKWQAGLLNGVGGKIEPGEKELDAMKREFLEEVGIQHDEWDCFLWYKVRSEHEILFYVASSDKVLEYRQMEEEKPLIINVDELKDYDHVSNLSFIVPLAKWFHQNRSYMKHPLSLQESD